MREADGPPISRMGLQDSQKLPRQLVLRVVLVLSLVLGLLAVLLPGKLAAGTTGKLTGHVSDKEHQPVVAATIVLKGTQLGAYSDDAGLYTILNIPAGTYEVSCTRLGFDPVLIQEVIVSADQTTKLDIEMGETTIRMAEVVVTAERPPVDLGLTSTKETLTSKDIESLPVQNLDDVVNLQAGVVQGHFRGGRSDEVQYQVDGISVNNAYDNTSMLKVDRSLLQEVQIISGTFDAEYGQAMSGVVNAVLKDGTQDYRLSAEVFSGGFIYPSGGGRLTPDKSKPSSIQNYQLTASGPLGDSTNVFIVSGRYYRFDDWVYATRRFLPTDRSDFERGIFNPTGDGKQEPLSYSREGSIVSKLTNTSLENLKFNYQVFYGQNRGRRDDYSYRYNPDGLATNHKNTLSHGLDVTATLGKATFLNFSARQNYLKYWEWRYANVYDPRYDEAGRPEIDPNYEQGAVIQGVDFTRFFQRTNALLIKSSVTSQVAPQHLVKIGGEFQAPRIEFGTPGQLAYATRNGVEQLVRHVNDPPEFPGVEAYHPLTAAAYAQDQIELTDLTVRAGLRLDYLDAQSTLPSELANPANAISDVPVSVPVPTTKKVAVAPRLGVAYPIEDRAAIHFAYGHFYQFPSADQLFSNADYNILRDLQAGGIDYGVLGNPDVKPERTVQYEVGYKHALTRTLGVELTAFYKDIRDLLGVEFITTYNGAEYARLTNVDFGNVFGLTLALDDRHIGPVSLSLDYTWQQAQGDASNPRETATRAEAGEDPRPRLVPFNWDQRHTFNMTVAMTEPGNYTCSAIVKVASGQPYTPVLEAGFGQGLQDNSGRKPTGTIIDLRLEKDLTAWVPGLGFFARVFNVLDTRFFNGSVFSSTGSPYYSRFPEADYVGLHDPTRFYDPRRIEIGMRLGMGGS